MGERGEMSVREAGHLGGESLKRKYGTSHFSGLAKLAAQAQIARMGRDAYNEHLRIMASHGGEANYDRRGPEYYSELGKKGGEALKEKVAGTNYYSKIAKLRRAKK